MGQMKIKELKQGMCTWWPDTQVSMNGGAFPGAFELVQVA